MQSPPEPPATFDLRRATLLALAILFAAALFVLLQFPPNHDVAWFLYAAGRVLEGDVLYRDVVDMNAPAAIWLSAIPEGLARLTGAWPATMHRLFVVALTACSLALFGRTLRSWLPADRGAWGAVLVATAFLVLVAPALEFGQRDHIAVILALPYLALSAERLRRADGTGAEGVALPHAWLVAAGILAGVGFMLKPVFGLAWLLPELFVTMRLGVRALRRPETIALLATFVVYALAVALFARGYFFIARLGAASYSEYSSTSTWELLLLRRAQFPLMAFAVWLAARGFSRLRDLGDVLALGALGFYLAVLVQRKGWEYHWIPASTLASVVVLIALASAFTTPAGERATPRAEVMPLVAAILLTLGLTAATASLPAAQREVMRGGAFQFDGLMRSAARHAGNGPIAALSTNTLAAFPLVNYTGLEWGLRFNTLWLLNGAYPPNPPGQPFRYHEPARMEAPERYQFDAVIEDLTTNPPTMLIVDRTPPGYVLNGFDYLEYFGQDERFERLMSGYREVEPVERYRVFIRGGTAE